MEEFIACFTKVSDPRQENVRHNLYEVLIIALCTLLCGGEDCTDMEAFGRAKRPFLRQFLRLKHGIPSHDTFSRVFRQLDPKPFQVCSVRFMERFAQGLDGVIAVDGKTLRGSFDRASGQSPLHMVHAWAVGQRLLLGQIATDAKSNEITAVPKLLAMLSLKGCIVTADAMSRQRPICAQIVEQGGDYVIALKGNQGTLHDMSGCFWKTRIAWVRIGWMTPRTRRSMPIMAASRPEPAQYTLISAGHRTSMPGRVWRRSGRWFARARPTARPQRKRRIIC